MLLSELDNVNIEMQISKPYENNIIKLDQNIPDKNKQAQYIDQQFYDLEIKHLADNIFSHEQELQYKAILDSCKQHRNQKMEFYRKLNSQLCFMKHDNLGTIPFDKIQKEIDQAFTGKITNNSLNTLRVSYAKEIDTIKAMNDNQLMFKKFYFLMKYFEAINDQIILEKGKTEVLNKMVLENSQNNARINGQISEVKMIINMMQKKFGSTSEVEFFAKQHLIQATSELHNLEKEINEIETAEKDYKQTYQMKLEHHGSKLFKEKDEYSKLMSKISQAKNKLREQMVEFENLERIELEIIQKRSDSNATHHIIKQLEQVEKIIMEYENLNEKKSETKRSTSIENNTLERQNSDQKNNLIRKNSEKKSTQKSEENSSESNANSKILFKFKVDQILKLSKITRYFETNGGRIKFMFQKILQAYNNMIIRETSLKNMCEELELEKANRIKDYKNLIDELNLLEQDFKMINEENLLHEETGSLIDSNISNIQLKRSDLYNEQLDYNIIRRIDQMDKIILYFNVRMLELMQKFTNLVQKVTECSKPKINLDMVQSDIEKINNAIQEIKEYCLEEHNLYESKSKMISFRDLTSESNCLNNDMADLVYIGENTPTKAKYKLEKTSDIEELLISSYPQIMKIFQLSDLKKDQISCFFLRKEDLLTFFQKHKKSLDASIIEKKDYGILYQIKLYALTICMSKLQKITELIKELLICINAFNINAIKVKPNEISNQKENGYLLHNMIDVAKFKSPIVCNEFEDPDSFLEEALQKSNSPESTINLSINEATPESKKFQDSISGLLGKYNALKHKEKMIPINQIKDQKRKWKLLKTANLNNQLTTRGISNKMESLLHMRNKSNEESKLKNVSVSKFIDGDKIDFYEEILHNARSAIKDPFKIEKDNEFRINEPTKKKNFIYQRLAKHSKSNGELLKKWNQDSRAIHKLNLLDKSASEIDIKSKLVNYRIQNLIPPVLRFKTFRSKSNAHISIPLDKKRTSIPSIHKDFLNQDADTGLFQINIGKRSSFDHKHSISNLNSIRTELQNLKGDHDQLSQKTTERMYSERKSISTFPIQNMSNDIRSTSTILSRRKSSYIQGEFQFGSRTQQQNFRK